ncbi:unnamed protein product, partial [Candidula unifasciata]
PCKNVICYNGGKCVASGTVGVCQCPQGYVGTWCETKQDPCKNYYCYNGGRCVTKANLAVCECPYGYVGTWCETKQ